MAKAGKMIKTAKEAEWPIWLKMPKWPIFLIQQNWRKWPKGQKRQKKNWPKRPN